jgi:transposase InsO family protein
VLSERLEFLQFASRGNSNMSELCRRYGISRPTGYKWLGRVAAGHGLEDRSRRPYASPRRTGEDVEARVCALRVQHPAWGGRKLHHYLRHTGLEPLPAPSTINSMLRRNGLLEPDRRVVRNWQRFEAAGPNRLWQMDFKGPVQTEAAPCNVLTVLDDYSRYNLCLGICPDQKRGTVQEQLVATFRRYGLPDRILCDNGPPWGSALTRQPYTKLTAWLLRQGVAVCHGRPYHPQTQGKDERFHLTLSLELLKPRPVWHEPAELAAAASPWRHSYNHDRPHEALGHETPASRYRPSLRTYSEVPPPIEYAPGDLIRRVTDLGKINFKGHEYLVSRAFTGEPVALRAVADGKWDVYYCFQRVAVVDLTTQKV